MELATFKVIVLRRQEELYVPSQHCTIRIILPHGSPDDLEQLWVEFEPPLIAQKISAQIRCRTLLLVTDVANCSEVTVGIVLIKLC